MGKVEVKEFKGLLTNIDNNDIGLDYFSESENIRYYPGYIQAEELDRNENTQHTIPWLLDYQSYLTSPNSPKYIETAKLLHYSRILLQDDPYSIVPSFTTTEYKLTIYLNGTDLTFQVNRVTNNGGWTIVGIVSKTITNWMHGECKFNIEQSDGKIILWCNYQAWVIKKVNRYSEKIIESIIIEDFKVLIEGINFFSKQVTAVDSYNPLEKIDKDTILSNSLFNIELHENENLKDIYDNPIFVKPTYNYNDDNTFGGHWEFPTYDIPEIKFIYSQTLNKVFYSNYHKKYFLIRFRYWRHEDMVSELNPPSGVFKTEVNLFSLQLDSNNNLVRTEEDLFNYFVCYTFEGGEYTRLFKDYDLNESLFASTGLNYKYLNNSSLHTYSSNGSYDICFTYLEFKLAIFNNKIDLIQPLDEGTLEFILTGVVNDNEYILQSNPLNVTADYYQIRYNIRDLSIKYPTIEQFKYYIKLPTDTDYKLLMSRNVYSKNFINASNNEMNYDTVVVNKLSGQGITLSQNIGYLYGDNTKQITQFKDYCNVNGLAFITTGNVVYSPAIGHGVSQNQLFYDRNIVPLNNVTTVKALVDFDHMLGVITNNSLQLFKIDNFEGTLVYSPAQILPYQIKDFWNINAELYFITPLGVFIHDGQNTQNISQAIDDRVKLYYETMKIAYNYEFGEIYLLSPEEQKFYCYNLITKTWTTFKIPTFTGKDSFIQYEKGLGIQIGGFEYRIAYRASNALLDCKFSTHMSCLGSQTMTKQLSRIVFDREAKNAIIIETRKQIDVWNEKATPPTNIIVENNAEKTIIDGREVSVYPSYVLPFNERECYIPLRHRKLFKEIQLSVNFTGKIKNIEMEVEAYEYPTRYQQAKS